MPTIPYRAEPRNVFASDPALDVWQTRRDDALRARRRYEAVWHLAQSYVAGRQWVAWSKRDRRVVNEPNPSKRERHTVNVLTAFLMTNVGKLVADDLRPALLFRSDSIEAREYVKQANLALGYCWDEELEAEQILYEAFMRMAVHGTSAIQASWDGSSGPTIAKDIPYQDGRPVLDADKVMELMGSGPRADVKIRDVKGRCRWRSLSVWQLLPPPGVEHERDFPWLLLDEAVSIEALRKQYGDKADALSEQRLNAVDLQGGNAGFDETDDPSGAGSPNLKGHVVRTTGYEMPTREYPQGRTCVWSQDRLLYAEDRLPIQIKDEFYHGVRFFKWYRLPGRFWAMGMIEPGIGPQRQRNRSRSQFIEWKDRAGLGRIYTRPGALSIEQLEGGKIAEVITVRQGIEFPTETQGLPPGSWLSDDVAMHDADMERVMGIGASGPGGPPAGVSAYASLSLLTEADDKRVGPILKASRHEIGWLARYTLANIKAYWPRDKQITLAGEDGAMQAFLFNASRLPDDIYVRIGSGAPAPHSGAAEIQKIFDLYDRSVSSGSPLGVQWLYQSLEAGRALPIPETPQHVQIEKAQIESLLIGRGGVVEVSPLDDHDIHIAIHTQSIADHSLIPGAEDVVRAETEHIAEHEQMKAQGGGPQAPTAGPQAPGVPGGMPGATTPNLQGPMGALGQQRAGAPPAPFAANTMNARGLS